MPGRHASDETYKYGFNDMLKDDELKGNSNSYDFGARMYDPRLGRWLSIDPHFSSYPALSPFIFAGNNPILMLDPDGGDIIDFLTAMQDYNNKSLLIITQTPDFTNWLNQFSNGSKDDAINFGSSTPGKRASIKLRFDETSLPPFVGGFTSTNYNGKNLMELDSKNLATSVTIDKLEIFVGLDKEKLSKTNMSSADAQALSATIHEVGLHAEKQAELIEKNTNSDGTINLKTLVKQYQEYYNADTDHTQLYAGKATLVNTLQKGVLSVVQNSTTFNTSRDLGKAMKNQNDYFNLQLKMQKSYGEFRDSSVESQRSTILFFSETLQHQYKIDNLKPLSTSQDEK
jgi:RHS repeat-associated protein